MRALLSRLLPYIALLAIGLALTAPLLQGDTLCTDDGALHIYRTVALDRALRDGVLFPRWFPDVAYGYGFPFFVYREPLNYYALEALHLAGPSIPQSFNLVLAASVIAAGLAMFLLARDVFGARGGLLAGIAYLSAPYALLGATARGNLPEVIAFALMPLTLFLFRRLVIRQQARYFAASIVAYAALFLTHNISSLLFTPVLVAFVALVSWADAPAARRSALSVARHARYAWLAIVLTLGVTAFFWLPALVEGDQAQLYLTHSTRGNNYNYNFIGLGELLAGPGQSDPHLLNPPLRIVFGWPQLALAALGVLSIRRAATREQRALIVAAAITLLAMAFMALPASKPIWDSLPLIRFVQFPWRLVGRAMLPAALLAGAAFLDRANRPAHREQERGARRWLPDVGYGACVFVLLLFTAPLAYRRTCPTPHDLDINDVHAYEHATGHIGVDPLGAYLPVTVIERPAGSPLEAQYAAGHPIERFDASRLPSGARILDANYGPNRAELVIDSPVAFAATYLAFAFPGWQVHIDERPVEIRPSGTYGLIAFDVPAGRHRLRIEFGNSPDRTLADSLSLIALAATVAASVLIHRRSRRVTGAGPSPAPPSGPVLSLSKDDPMPPTSDAARAAAAALIALAVFVAAKALLLDPGLTPLRGDALAGVSHPLGIIFGDRLALLGYDVTPSATSPGETVRVDLYWKALAPLNAAYQAEVGLADAQGWPWSPKHADRPRDFTDYPAAPTWPPDAYVVDSLEFEVLPGTPPGEYVLAAQVFDKATLAPLAPGAASLPGQFSVPIGSIRVDRAARSFDAGQLRIYGGERHELDADLALLGYNIDRVDTVPGESVLLTFFWQADRVPPSDRAARVELVAADGRVWASDDFQIGGPSYPTSRWREGEQIISRVTMRVPAAAATGEYHWRAALLDAVGKPAGEFDMQPAFRVVAPERSFSVPQMENRLGLDIGDLATLLGFDLASDRLSPGDAIGLTLHWRARAETDSAYKVFIHVLDAGGRIVAQADAVPVNGARPTTGWLPGEVIADRYSIALTTDVPPGTYHITAGLYDGATGARLKSVSGDEAILLTDVLVR